MEKVKVWLLSHKLVVVLSLFLVVALIVTPIALREYKRYTRQGDDILVEYLDLSEDHVYQEVTLEEFEQLQADQETFIIYMGYEACDACQTNVPLANELFKEKGIDLVYYYRFNYANDFEQEVYETKKYDFIGTPIFIYFKDGEYLFSNQSSQFRKSGDPIIISVELATEEYLNIIKEG